MNKMKKTLVSLLVIILDLSLAACTQPTVEPDQAVALDYPTKPIEIIVPYGAGGGQDVFTRITAKYMLKYLPKDSSVVVNNVTGGGGVVGATAMADALNDGYKLGSIVPFQL